MGTRAIGIVRVSRVKGREGDSFASPGEQADRIRAACQRDNLTLTSMVEELDVSGGMPLDQRPGLGPAVHAVETGQADVIVGAYFDRLFRSLRAQAECVERVERAGGSVLAVDIGQVTNESAGQWLSGTMLGAVSEYQRRTTAERAREAQQRAINRGVPPWPRVTTGYQRQPDGTYAPHPRHASVVRAAFERRADGATVREVRQHLLDHGLSITYPGVIKLLQSRVVLGEIHAGKHTPNLTAHEPIVDRTTWQSVQDTHIPAGRRSGAPRLLARLGILRCGTCDGRLSAAIATGAGGGKYPIYRCGNHDCPQRVSVSTHIADSAVVETAKRELSDLQGRASAAARARELVATRDRAQAELDAAIRVLEIVGDEPAAVDRLGRLRAARDEAQAAVDETGDAAEIVVSVDDWDRLSFDAQRALLRSAIRRAVVMPGRGPDRVRVEPFS